jgi:hypothetical protein
MSFLLQLYARLLDILARLMAKLSEYLKRHTPEQENEQMYEVIQQLRSEHVDDSSSSSSDSISSYGYGDHVSPLSSSNNSLA